MKRILLIFCLSTLLPTMTFLPKCFAQLGKTVLTEKQIKEFEKAHKKNYFNFELKLGDLVLDKESAGKVKKITLKGFNESPVLAYHDKDTLQTSTTDPMLLTTVQRTCSEDAILRPYFHPNNLGGGFGGPYVNGTLEIYTEKRTITILITVVGFQFGKENDGFLRQSLFHSWALAKVVDNMIAKATENKKHLSQKLFTALSGESVIEQNKKIYWETRDSSQLRQQVHKLTKEVKKLQEILEEKEGDNETVPGDNETVPGPNGTLDTF